MKRANAIISRYRYSFGLDFCCLYVDAIFEVELRKGLRGLGFSVLEYDGFIFIKQLFPLEAACQSGALQEGDIILSANGNTLADLSSFVSCKTLAYCKSCCILRYVLFVKSSTLINVYASSGSKFFFSTNRLGYSCKTKEI